MNQSPYAWFLSTRKGMLTLLVIVMALLLEVAIVVLTIRGRMTVESAIQTSLGTLFTSVLGVVAAISGVAKEDAAAKSASTSQKEGDVQ